MNLSSGHPQAPYKVRDTQKSYFYGLAPGKLRGALVDNHVITFAVDDTRQYQWKIQQDVLLNNDIMQKLQKQITQTTHLAGMWVAEKVLSENTTNDEYPEWTIGRIEQVAWSAAMVPTLVVHYPGNPGAETAFFAGGSTVEVANQSGMSTVTADENGWFLVDTDRGSSMEEVREAGQMVILKSELLDYRDEAGMKTRESDIAKKQVSLQMQSVDIAQRTEEVHRRHEEITSRENELTEAQDKLQKDVEEFEQLRSEAVHTGNEDSTKLEQKLLVALKETKDADARIESLRRTLQQTNESYEETTNEHINELNRRLVEAEASAQSAKQREEETQRQFDASRQAVSEDTQRREAEIEAEIAKAVDDKARYTEMEEQARQQSHDSADDNDRITSLEAQLAEALENMRDYEHRVTALHEERMTHKKHTDHMLSEHEEFVERSNQRSMELLTALEQSESKYREINLVMAEDEANRERAFRKTSGIHNIVPSADDASQHYNSLPSYHDKDPQQYTWIPPNQLNTRLRLSLSTRADQTLEP